MNFLTAVAPFILGAAICGQLEYCRARKKSRPKRSPFAVTATPESRARMENWRQHTAQPVPDDLCVLTELKRWYEDPPYVRLRQTNKILVDFGSSAPEFRINEIGDKVPNKYPPFERNDFRIYGLWAASREPIHGNVWECYIDYWEKLKHE